MNRITFLHDNIELNIFCIFYSIAHDYKMQM